MKFSAIPDFHFIAMKRKNSDRAIFPITSVNGKCISDKKFKLLKCIGEGTYGTVYKAEIRDDNRPGRNNIVALKRITLHNEKMSGFPLTSLREIKTLSLCSRHKYIVKLLDIVVGVGSTVYLLFEYCDHDLLKITKAHKKAQCGSSSSIRPLFTESESKRLALQLLSAIEFMHSKHIVHRDIKLANLLYTSKGELKVADFGLARIIGFPLPVAGDDAKLTSEVTTLWYRAPELLLGKTAYSFEIDIWSAGI